MTELQSRLFSMQDAAYRDFTARLTPNIPIERVIGIRTPALRTLAKELCGTETAERFMLTLPHEYLEENSLHGMLIERIKDYGDCVCALNVFLPCVDNWASCDLISPKVFKKHRGELIEQIRLWLADSRTYVIRFGMRMLMSHFLDEDFRAEYLDLAASVESGEYYVNMMQAWFFATALAKQYSETLPYIEGRRLSVWVHNKTIQKAVESYRISDEQKTYLKTLKIKKT